VPLLLLRMHVVHAQLSIGTAAAAAAANAPAAAHVAANQKPLPSIHTVACSTTTPKFRVPSKQTSNDCCIQPCLSPSQIHAAAAAQELSSSMPARQQDSSRGTKPHVLFLLPLQRVSDTAAKPCAIPLQSPEAAPP